MNDFALLFRELDMLEATQAGLAEIARRTDDGRRYDLIQLRKKLAQQTAEVGSVAETIFEAAGPDLLQTYRAKFSQVRTAAALHQANWPAVQLNEAAEAYRLSAHGVREAYDAFVTWVRRAAADLEKAAGAGHHP